MSVAPWVWALTIVVIAGLIAFDYFAHVRKAHVPSLKEAAVWSGIYVSIAATFGVVVLIFGGGQMGAEYFGGWLTEYALSVDNLFVFLVIMSSFSVARKHQQKVLLFGIVFALLSRSVFILAGKALIDAFSWAFYLFGALLIFTGLKLLLPGDDEPGSDNFVIRLAKRLLPTTEHYDDDKLITVENGKRMLTPMLLVMVAIGGTDVLFALDSIPAIYGLTTNVYVVFTATAFSLMGLRQLYFLIDTLLDRLIYLDYGLALILTFIGIKMILEALHGNQLPFLNQGQPIPVYTFDIGTSLLVIVSVLVVTVAASLASRRGRVASQVRSLERLADAYLKEQPGREPVERERQYQQLAVAEAALLQMNADLAAAAMDDDVTDKLAAAHRLHLEAAEA